MLYDKDKKSQWYMWRQRYAIKRFEEGWPTVGRAGHKQVVFVSGQPEKQGYSFTVISRLDPSFVQDDT